jgi:hypothetical protein
MLYRRRPEESGRDDDHGEHEDAPQGVRGAVGDADVGADGEVGEIGDPAERGDRDDARGPAAVAAGREPQRVVLEGLLGGGADIGWADIGWADIGWADVGRDGPGGGLRRGL